MREIKQNRMWACIGFLTGIIVFIVIYGVKIINPTYVDWLLGLGDLSQHYLGWELYRKGDWKFPLGLTDMAAYPLETSVIFTDSIPIFALFFKTFKSVLPQNFQYFGIYGILCFGLQGLFAVKILKKLKVIIMV